MKNFTHLYNLKFFFNAATPNLYATSPDKGNGSQAMLGVKHILPMLPSTLSAGTQVTNTLHNMKAPVTVHSATNLQNQGQQQVGFILFYLNFSFHK